MKLEGLQRLLLRECDKAGGILPWAKRHGIPYSTVRHAALGSRLPTEQLCAALGYRSEIRFVRIKSEAAA